VSDKEDAARKAAAEKAAQEAARKAAAERAAEEFRRAEAAEKARRELSKDDDDPRKHETRSQR